VYKARREGEGCDARWLDATIHLEKRVLLVFWNGALGVLLDFTVDLLSGGLDGGVVGGLLSGYGGGLFRGALGFSNELFGLESSNATGS
jgi:hypothetical protein